MLSRNQQVKVFYAIVQHFRPAFVLMENVMAVFCKEGGVYIKTAIASLLSCGYQTRVGAIDALGPGLPPGRWR